MRRILATTFSPLVSLLIFTLGNGLFTTLVIVNLHERAVSPTIIGAMTGVYYTGFILGSFRIEKLILRVSHIRAFSAFASGLAVVILSQSLVLDPYFWLAMRLIGGFCTAGLFIVIESWLLALSTPKNRGRILALYMIVLYAAQALGQLLLNVQKPNSFVLFAICAMLSSLSVIPLAMSRTQAPTVAEPSTLSLRAIYSLSGTGVISCFGGGLLLGAIYGLLPLYLAETLRETNYVSTLTALVILGGMLLQYPIGRISDSIERRLVLIGLGIAITVLSLVFLLPFHGVWVLAVMLFILGGFTFTVYPIAICHACDSIDPKHIVAATQSLLLAYSVGAAVGPFIAPLFIDLLGVRGLFAYLGTVTSILTGYLITRHLHRPRMVPEEQFVLAPQTTPMVYELDPRREENSAE